MIAALPLLLVGVFQRSERATRDWLGRGLDGEVEALEQILEGHVAGTRIGRYLESLRTRFPSAVVAELREHGAQPFDPTALPELDAESPLSRRRPGGLGLHLVRRLTTAFRYEYRDGVGVTRVVLREPR